jgi:hypothetical protein
MEMKRVELSTPFQDGVEPTWSMEGGFSGTDALTFAHRGMRTPFDHWDGAGAGDRGFGLLGMHTWGLQWLSRYVQWPAGMLCKVGLTSLCAHVL